MNIPPSLPFHKTCYDDGDVGDKVLQIKAGNLNVISVSGNNVTV